MGGQFKAALVPVTGSPLDELALGIACDLVRQAKGTVYVLYVIEVPLQLPLDAELATEAARGERVLQALERIAKAHKCKVEGEILQARSLAPAVIEEAEQRGADMIVVGTPYQEHFGTPTISDVIPFPLKYSPVPVLVYRGSTSGTGLA